MQTNFQFHVGSMDTAARRPHPSPHSVIIYNMFIARRLHGVCMVHEIKLNSVVFNWRIESGR